MNNHYSLITYFFTQTTPRAQHPPNINNWATQAHIDGGGGGGGVVLTPWREQINQDFS